MTHPAAPASACPTLHAARAPHEARGRRERQARLPLAVVLGAAIVVFAALGCTASAPEEESGSTESNLSAGTCGAGFAPCVRGGGGKSCASKHCTGACVSEVAACVAGNGGPSCASRCDGGGGSLNTAVPEACLGAILASAAWCRTPLTCAATLAAACGACVDKGCVAQALNQFACDPGKGGQYAISAPYPDGSCCQVCANGKLDVCDPGLCARPSRPSCNDPDAYGNCP